MKNLWDPTFLRLKNRLHYYIEKNTPPPASLLNEYVRYIRENREMKQSRSDSESATYQAYHHHLHVYENPDVAEKRVVFNPATQLNRYPIRILILNIYLN